MHYVKQFNINGVDTKQVACIELRGKPNAATVGAVGLLGIDVDSPLHEVYKCVAVNGSIYTWELLSSGLSTIAATISGKGEKLVQFPYDTLKIPTGYLIKIGDLIIDSEGYEYQVSAINVASCSATYCGTAFMQGEPGLTPFIGENGHWWIGDTDTGVLAPSIFRYERGSYVGTSTYGAENPNTLTFSFVPKVVFIMGEHTGDQMMLINGTACGMSHYCLSSDYSNKSIGTNAVTWDGEAVQWYYNTTGADMPNRYINGQLNGSYSTAHPVVDYKLTETNTDEWRQDETGAFPCDFLVVKLKKPLPDNVETYCVMYDAGESEGSAPYEVYFDSNGEARIYFGGASDNSGYVNNLRVEGGSYVDYTVYEATAYSTNSLAETYHYIAIGYGVNGTDDESAAGYIPVKGKDYFTPEDIEDMVESVIAALPKYNGEVVSV